MSPAKIADRLRSIIAELDHAAECSGDPNTAATIGLAADDLAALKLEIEVAGWLVVPA